MIDGEESGNLEMVTSFPFLRGLTKLDSLLLSTA